MFYMPQELRDDLFVLPDPLWHRDVVGQSFCRTCERVLPGTFPRSIDARLTQVPADTVVSGVFPLGVGVAHVELLRVLRPYMDEFAFGRCLDRDGTVLPDYGTFYTPDIVIERTDEGEYHECPDCGSIRTATRDYGFLTEDAIKGRRVLQPYATTLLIAEELVPLLDRSKLPPFELIPYPVRPPLPPDYRSPYERATELLKAAFGGDLRAAHAAVEQEARRIRMPEGNHEMGIILQGMELIVSGHVTCGMMRVSSIRVPE